jgi:pimeloyl-ACP methyl ester carboxylesterase
MSGPTTVTHRLVSGNAGAIVFVHGFGGDPRFTWGLFPELLAADPALGTWDILSVGYPSTLLLPDIAGLWSAQPDIRTVADELATRSQYAPLDRYSAIAFIAHSMGGLAVQRALVDRSELANRVSHVLLFGTPSFGLAKASFWRFWKRQISDMCVDAEFIASLRKKWTEEFSGHESFRFLAVAGDQDEFVPRGSSLDGIPPPGFPLAQQAVVPGNHLQIVKPMDADDLPVKVATRFLTGGQSLADAAAVASERLGCQRTIDRFAPGIGALDDKALVELALALDALGRPDEALAALAAQPHRGTDATGVLAGRLKRRWLHDRVATDAQEALRLYRDALDRSLSAKQQSQIAYHAINVAFLEWAFLDDRAAAQASARTALAACAASPIDKWRLATEGEAALILGNDAAALAAYDATLTLKLKPREKDSIYQQAIFELDLAENVALAKVLRERFVQ